LQRTTVSKQRGTVDRGIAPIQKDPFDRELIAQAITHSLSLISIDPLIHANIPVVPNLTVRWET
jgi:PIN domain nuclease of toxin-antitoxin system